MSKPQRAQFYKHKSHSYAIYSAQGTQANSSKVRANTKMPPPQNFNELKFNGMIKYLRQYIKKCDYYNAP